MSRRSTVATRLMSSSGIYNILFKNSEPGIFFDPSDLTTLYQDSAGTTPVTAPNQPVGLMLDKSKNGIGGNGIYDRNLLTYTEQFDNAVWIKGQSTVTANTAVAPDGTTTADSILDTAVSNIHYCIQDITSLTPSGKTYTVSAYAKANTLNFMTLGISDISSGTLYAVAVFNIATGTVSTSGAAGTGYSVVSSSVSNAGNGWYRCVVTVVAGTSVTFLRGVLAPNKTGVITTAAGGYESYLGNGSGFYAWGAQLETGTTATAYQPITSSWAATIAGNHATQATSTQRPIYGINPIVGTRNLLTYTEQFTNATWLTQGGTWSAVDANGFQTFTEDTATSQHRLYDDAYSVVSGKEYTLSAQVAYGTRRWVFLSLYDGVTTVTAWFDLLNGIKGSVTAGTTSTMTTVSPSIYNITLTRTAASTTATANVQIGTQIGDGETVGWTGTGATMRVAKYQFEQSATATAYQKVVSQYEVTEAGVQSASYLAFDGVDDGMVTNTITPNIDKVQVFAGVRKLSDAGGAVAELSNTIGNNGTFGFYANGGSSNDFYLGLNGSITTFSKLTTYNAPITAVISAIFDIAGASNATEIIPRVNATVPTITIEGSAYAGTGNFLAYPLYIGRRGGSTIPFNGRLYSLITRFGPNLNSIQITNAERYVNKKTGAY